MCGFLMQFLSVNSKSSEKITSLQKSNIHDQL